ncbi:MAG: hypothetical protein QG625_2241 [Cyanobacteriota bacterium erpe_2018_sw_39hr_WHONDRS-SW48-000098_B_bin.30]|nr:hypothetical protein [Cyanobacteriota bacterium erpe_2018_sw_39hr_WHONDRS-SW48-000098_B_bin.30]
MARFVDSGCAFGVCLALALAALMPGFTLHQASANTPHFHPSAGQKRAVRNLRQAFSGTRAVGANSFEQLIAQGKKQFIAKQFKEAAQTFTDCLRHNPEDIGVSYYQGLSAFYAQDYDLSRLALARVVALSVPNNPFSVNALNCFTGYGQAYGGAVPYFALDQNYGHFVRWSKTDFPLKICITRGLSLPPGCAPDVGRISDHGLCPYLCDPRFYRGLSTVPGYQNSWLSLAYQGAQAWEPARQSGFIEYQFVDDPTLADIVVFWTNEDLGPQVSGRTFPHVQPDDNGKVVIVVKVVDSQQAQRNNDNSAKNREVFEYNLRQCVAHELGHAFGILGHSHHPVDVMRDNPEPLKLDRYGHLPAMPVITQDDILTLEAIYTVPPDFCLTASHRTITKNSKTNNSVRSIKHR